MRHLRTIITAVIGSGLLTLTACSGSADPSTPPPPSATVTVTPATASRTPTPTPTPSASAPTPPVMPSAAKAHTKAGAKAFVEYFWEVVNYAQESGNTAPIRELADARGCTQCRAGVAGIRNVYDHGGRIVGGHSTVKDFKVRLFKVRGTDFATVDYDIAVSAVEFDYADESRDNSDPATGGRRRARLSAEPGTAGRVVLLEGLS